MQSLEPQHRMFLFVARCFLKDVRDLFHALSTSLHCIVSVLVARLGFTGKSSHQMFNSLAHDVSLLKFFEGL